MDILNTILKKALLLLQLQVTFMNTSAAVCPFALDIAFLLDSSGSITEVNYRDMKTFINNVIEHFYISPTETNIGVVSFSSSARTEIPFTSPQKVDIIKSSVWKMKYDDGSTRMDLGLKKTREELFSKQGEMRTNMADVLLAITDGKSNYGYRLKAKQQSQQLKDDGVVIFALGIGSNVDAAELKALASDESRVFRFASVREMSPKDNALKIALALCSGATQVGATVVDLVGSWYETRYQFEVARTSNAVILPVVTQHSLVQHIVMSRTTTDDFECALLCIRHKSCYSFNLHTSSRLCELSNAKRIDFPGDFLFDHGSVYFELEFVRG